MKDRYDDGFSSLDRSFLDRVYFLLYGREITNKGCSDCYRDAYMEISIRLKRDKKMPKQSSYQLKPGAVITFFGSPVAYTNANLTDEVALRYLSLNESNAKMFAHLPSNWESAVADYKVDPSSSTTLTEDHPEIDALKEQIEGLETDKHIAETAVFNLTEELAQANKALEEVLAQRDALLAEVEQLKANIPTPKATRARKVKAEESKTESETPEESSEQSLGI